MPATEEVKGNAQAAVLLGGPLREDLRRIRQSGVFLTISPACQAEGDRTIRGIEDTFEVHSARAWRMNWILRLNELKLSQAPKLIPRFVGTIEAKDVIFDLVTPGDFYWATADGTLVVRKQTPG